MEVTDYLIIIVLAIIAGILIILWAKGFFGRGLDASLELFRFGKQA